MSQLNLFRDQPAPGPHTYRCEACGCEWTQRDGGDPQRHRINCPNRRRGDELLPLDELPGESFEDIFGGAV